MAAESDTTNSTSNPSPKKSKKNLLEQKNRSNFDVLYSIHLSFQQPQDSNFKVSSEVQ
jgi:hypothetical protein